MTFASALRWPFAVRVVLVTAISVFILVPNAWLCQHVIGLILEGASAVDWNQYVLAAGRFLDPPALYAVNDHYAYHYSPFLAPLFGALSPIGTDGWRVLHIAALATLPTWPMRIVTVLSWPFWFDVGTGNILIFVVALAAWALRGNQLVAMAYLVVLILVPRPLMMPVGVWLLWRQRELRFPFVALFFVHSVAVFVGGWSDEWIHALQAAAGDVLNPTNIGPSRFIGAWWILLGMPLAGVLTWRGRLGWAALAASLYWLPYYLLILLLELDPRTRKPRQIEDRVHSTND